ncbi:MAG TPA: DUF1223 domain-containing protein [Alphaproteobacteria bacterium]|nr:DUF1223 domain-containing protein [Alphaproteobacteria bacterium]HNS43614.1 DUF1223 domain-containing protein [Alphaproteobacteria bacterium]
MKNVTCFILSGLVVLFSISPVSAADGRKTPIFGYSWPFGNRDIAAEVEDHPILLELFSDQGCMYCPPADHLFNDLIRKTRITGLDYHVNALNVVTDNPYAIKDSYDRHLFYSVINHAPRYTPEMVVNGRALVKGYMYGDVLSALKDTAPLIFLDIANGEKKDSYHFHLQAMKLGRLKGFDDHVMVKLVEYLKPVRSPIKTGPNEGMDIEYLHIVSKVIPLDNWLGDERDYSFNWTPSENAAGLVVILERQDNGPIAFGEIKLP